ncbi:MAG TPA: DinB family protein [Ferruginibacter sp.]|nr:DinB family protein [Ferruginibacter sp.]
MKNMLIDLYYRDIDKLKEEMAGYTDQKLMWSVAPGIKNSGGNLCLHLIGNLNHFIGAVLGKNGYVRNRDAEFSQKNIPVEELITQVEHTKEMVIQILAALEEETLELDFPVPLNGQVFKTNHMLIFMLGHLNYHLGQINYHRRFLQQTESQ